MVECDVCGKEENMPYRCRYCGDTYCSDHRLPENHDCVGLQDWGDPQGVFSSGFDDSVDQQGSSGGLLAGRLPSGSGGLLSSVSGNVSYVLLGVMLVFFVLQFVIAPLAGLRPFQSQGWLALFTLSSENPLFVWTWFTSVFSHSGVGHLFGNAIVIFFFGPLVERRVGSKAFLALFLFSGAVAGLAQVGLGVALGAPVVRVLGASGAALAIMAVLTVLNPGMRVLLYFLIPVPIWVITGGYAVISVLGVLGPSVLGPSVANGAHLVGLVIGLAYGKYIEDRVRSTPGEYQLGGSGPGRGRF